MGEWEREVENRQIQKHKMVVVDRVQVLYKMVAHPTLGLAAVEEASSRGRNPIDEVGKGVCESLPQLEGLLG